MGGVGGFYGPPTPLDTSHDVASFDCGKPPLTDWLRTQALKNEGRGSRTFVVGVGKQIAAYYALAAGHVDREHAPSNIARNMPNPIPVIVLGRLAVDYRHKNKRLGVGLLRDAIKRTLVASREIGARAIMVHAIDDEAVGFYLQYGFKSFPTDPRTLFLSLTQASAAL